MQLLVLPYKCPVLCRHRSGHFKVKSQKYSKWKTKKNCVGFFSINTANFKAFYLDKKLTSNLIFLKSVTSVLFSIDRNAILLEFALLSHSTKTSLLWCFTASWSPKKNIRFISSCCCPFKMWKENLENVLLAPVLQVYRHELSIY